MQKMLLPLLLLTSIVSMSGCQGQRVVLVPETITTPTGLKSNVVRLAEPVECRVYVWDGEDWVAGVNDVTLPEGWMVGPPPPAKEKP